MASRPQTGLRAESSSSHGTSLHGLTIDGARLLARLDELAAVGSTGDGGCCRLALTDADRDGRDLVVTWMRDLGLDVVIDGVGNVIGTWSVGSGAPVMTGSHIDTVRTGAGTTETSEFWPASRSSKL